MDAAKLRLSETEMQLVMNSDWILTKNAILEKVKKMLALLQVKQQDYFQSLQNRLPASLLLPSPKISRGENYQGLPYIILDYPRFFQKENIFAIRNLFWWGHFFSGTLHLSGVYKKQFAGKIAGAYAALSANQFYCCIHEEQWEHHFEDSNYRAVGEWDKNTFEEKIGASTFIKLAKKIPLTKWNEAPELLFRQSTDIIHVLLD